MMTEVITFRASTELKEHYAELAKEYEPLKVNPSALMRCDLEKSMQERQSQQKEVNAQ